MHVAPVCVHACMHVRKALITACVTDARDASRFTCLQTQHRGSIAICTATDLAPKLARPHCSSPRAHNRHALSACAVRPRKPHLRLPENAKHVIICRTPKRHDAETIIADLENLKQIATFILVTTQKSDAREKTMGTSTDLDTILPQS